MRAHKEKEEEEERIREENRRIKEWERKFDEEQKFREEELIRKFYSDDFQKETSENPSEPIDQNQELSENKDENK